MMWPVIISISGALALFLFALIRLGESFQVLMGARVRHWMERSTRNTWLSVLTGLIATTILNSSSFVIILTILFINSGALTLRNSLGMILGANLGTTISSQMMSLNIGQYAPILMVGGLLGNFIAKNGASKKSFEALFYLGLLFYGLYLLEYAVEPLKNEAVFTTWMSHLQNPFSASLSGAIITVILQSSSATVGLAIVLAKQSAINLTASIGVMMGAELGTCADTLLATVKGSRASIKAGLFHLFFNLFSISVGLITFVPFVWIVQTISGDASLEAQIANAHVLFNLMGVLSFVWFLPAVERLLNRLLPEKIPAGQA